MRNDSFFEHHDFNERLQFSEGVELTEGILRHIYGCIPGATDVVRASKQEDKSGTDYWVNRYPLPRISVDLKSRSFCPIERYQSDDACIETCSVWRGGVCQQIGWTLDPTKRTDLLVYTWPNPKGLRFWILYFPLLCQAAKLNLPWWNATYPARAAENIDYLTWSIYPPRTVIADAIRALTES